MHDLSAVETYLKDFHQRLAGSTSAAFGALPARGADARYPSSYAALAACVPDSPASQTVLDLGCGDGHLLKLLSDRRQASLHLIGVDMSQGELDAARAALPDDVALLNERAQALSIATGTVDCVISHMAMMLMDDIEQVVREVRRVLRPQGQFAAIVGRTFLLGEANEVFRDVFRSIAQENAMPLSFGDARTRSSAGWAELLQHDFDALRVTDIDVDWSPRPEELWDSMTETYSVDRLSASAKATLQARFLHALTAIQQSDGTIRTGWGLRLIRAQAK